jgi:hypothetical protein
MSRKLQKSSYGHSGQQEFQRQNGKANYRISPEVARLRGANPR